MRERKCTVELYVDFLAQQHMPNAVILDVIMVGMDGWAVLKAFKQDPQLADIPVILMTMMRDARIGYALGAAEYLTKPVDFSRLLEKIQAWLPTIHA